MQSQPCATGCWHSATICGSALLRRIISTPGCCGISPIPRACSPRSIAMSDLATRAVLSDDGEIRMTLYRDDGRAVAVVLAPVRAVALAGELIEAAVPKLGNVMEENSMMRRA